MKVEPRGRLICELLSQLGSTSTLEKGSSTSWAHHLTHVKILYPCPEPTVVWTLERKYSMCFLFSESKHSCIGGFLGVCHLRLQAGVFASNLSNVSVVEEMTLPPQWECPSDSCCGPALCRRLSHAMVCAQHMWPQALDGKIVRVCQNNDFSVFLVSSQCEPMKVPLSSAWCVVLGELPCLSFSISQGEIAKQHSFM